MGSLKRQLCIQGYSMSTATSGLLWSTYETQVALLRFWYSRDRIERALQTHRNQVLSSMGGGIAGAVTGGAIGGGAGLVIGIVGGPVGMGIGLVLGTTGGILAGTLAGGGTATAVTHGLVTAAKEEWRKEEDAENEEEEEGKKEEEEGE